MNTKVFLLLHRPQKMNPYIYNPLDKTVDPQIDSGYFCNASKTLNEKRVRTYKSHSFSYFCCLFSLIYKLIDLLHYLFHIHATLKALIDFLNPFLVSVVIQHFFHCMF